MRVVVTRPEREAGAWLDALRARGHEPLALPLVAIEPPDASAFEALADAWGRLGECSAVMFVSVNAVRGFFEARPGVAAWPAMTRAWAPGPGTAEALREAGVPLALVDTPPANAGQFDSEHLWRQVAPQVGPGTRVLFVQGGDALGRPVGRDWLQTHVIEAGGVAQACIAYRRRAPHWSAAQHAQARVAASAGTLWLVTSSEGVGHLRHLLGDQTLTGAVALATHPRIAKAAEAAGFGRVVTSRPGREDVLASIESLQ